MSLVLLVLLPLDACFGQKPARPTPRLTKLGLSGLSQNMVQAITEDHLGFMWFGTKDGLNRYDGYKFTIFKNNPTAAASLPGNDVRSLYEDSANRLWVGTTEGLCIYHHALDRFIPLQFEGGQVEANPLVVLVKEDLRGNIWVITKGSKLICIKDVDLKQGTIEPYAVYTLEADRSVNDVQHPYQLHFDADEEIWVVAPTSILKGSYVPGGDSVALKSYSHPLCGLPEAYPFMLHGSNGARWFRCRSGHFQQMSGADLLPPAVYIEYVPFTDHSKLTYYYGVEDDEGNFWLGGGDAALAVLYPEEGRSDNVIDDNKYQQQGKLSHSIFRHKVSALYKSSSGQIWVGTNGYGLYVYHPLHRQFNNGYNTMREVNSGMRFITKARDGTLWFAQANHFLYANPPGADSILEVRHGAKLAREFAALPGSKPRDDRRVAFVAGVHEDQRNFLWVLGLNNLIRFEKSGHRITGEQLFPLNHLLNPLSADETFHNMAARDSMLWITTAERLIGFNTVTHASAAFPYHSPGQHPGPGLATSLETPKVMALCDSLVYIVTDTDSYVFHRALKSFARLSFTSNGKKVALKVRHMEIDPLGREGYYWLSTSSHGLVAWNIRTGECSIYDQSVGLPENSVYAAREGGGLLWCSTNQGLFSLNPENDAIVVYTYEDGLQDNEFNLHASHKAFDGELIFGGIKGYNRFYSNHIGQSGYNSPVVFVELVVNHKTVRPGEAGYELPAAVSMGPQLEFTDVHKTVSFGFASLDFTNPAKNKYAYMLENFDEHWQEIGNQRQVTFANLSPGRYTLMVKGTNSSGVWSTHTAKINFTVLPPWYTSWWAYMIYFLLIFAIVAVVFRLQLASKLERAETQKLKELDAFKTRFFTNITHEFRTPLTLIQGMPLLMKEAATAGDWEALDEQARVIENNSNRVIAMVDQLLDLSKLEAGMLKIKRTQVDLHQFLTNHVGSYLSHAHGKQVELTFTSAADSVCIDADEGALTHIFQNLIGNALKFTEKGNVTIHLATRNNSEAEVQIADSGVGIDPVHLDRIFDRFYQADDRGQRSYGGSGIGLAIVREMVNLLNGKIAVRSALGQGTTFTLHFPLSAKVAMPESAGKTDVKAENMPPAHTPAPVEESGVKPLLLLVEDHPDMRYYIAKVLSKDYELATARDGEEGYAKAVELLPDFIITDWMMPGKTGVELIKDLRQNRATSHIPVMLLTARADQPSKIEGLDTGAEAYLVKPFDPQELLGQIKNLIAYRENLKAYVNGIPAATTIAAADEQRYSPEAAFLEKTLSAIHARLADPELDGDWLAEQHFLSRSQFARKLRAVSGHSVTALIRAERIKTAKALLKENRLSIAEVAFATGFADPSYFSRTFSKEVGISPSEYQQGNC